MPVFLTERVTRSGHPRTTTLIISLSQVAHLEFVHQSEKWAGGANLPVSIKYSEPMKLRDGGESVLTQSGARVDVDGL